MTSPIAPPTLPQYMIEGLSKQDDQTLHDAREFIDELLAAREQRREQPISEDELPADAEVIEAKSSSTSEDAQNTSRGSPVINECRKSSWSGVVVVTTVGLVFLCSAQHLFSKQACVSS